MLTGVALAWSELPLVFLERYRLALLAHERGGEKEVRFLQRAASPVLPVWHEGRVTLARWGSRRGDSRHLPCTAWARHTSIEAGLWAGWGSEAVDIPATAGLDNGVWYAVRQGIRGVLVHDERGRPVVYVIVTPASHYYQVMTRSEWMPLLIGERI